MLCESGVVPNWGGGGKLMQMVKIVFAKIVLEGLRFFSDVWNFQWLSWFCFEFTLEEIFNVCVMFAIT